MRHNIINHIISSASMIFDSRLLYLAYNTTNSILYKALAGHWEHQVLPYETDQNIIDYDIYMTTNPEEYISNLDQIKLKHLHDMVYICNPPANNIKKEDKFLIQQKLAGSNIIFRNTQIADAWFGGSEYEYLEYGIPPTNRTISSDRRSIIVINYEKSHSLDLLYYNIKQNFPDAVMLASIDELDYDQICNILQEYKICICAGSSYDVLCAAYNGCTVFSTERCDNIQSIQVSSFDQIFSLLPQAINSYRLNEDQDILEQYSFDNFTQKLTDISKNILRKPVIL